MRKWTRDHTRRLLSDGILVEGLSNHCVRKLPDTCELTINMAENENEYDQDENEVHNEPPFRSLHDYL